MSDNYRAGYELGQVLAPVLIAIPALYFLSRAIGSEARSPRLANLALCCGFAGWSLSTVGEFFWVLSGLSGLIGVTLAIMALVIRRRDRGTGAVRPILGLLLSAMVLMGSAAHILLPLLIDQGLPEGEPLEEPGAGAWTYRSLEYDFQLSLPSSRWQKESPSSRSQQIAFTHPSNVQLLLESVAGRTAGDFERAAGELASSTGRVAELTAVNQQRGLNSKGCRYASFTATDRNKRAFIANSLIWCVDKQVTTASTPSGALIQLIFKGRASKRVNVELLGKTAEFILNSVEDGS